MKNKKIIKIGQDDYREILSRKEIEAKISEIAKRIAIDYAGVDSLILLVVTNGGMFFGIFLAMALQDLGISALVDTIRIKRCQEDGKFMSEVKISSKPSVNLFNRHVIVIEDLIDEGISMNFLDHYLKTTEGMMPKSIEYCVLIVKKEHAKLSFEIKYFMRNEAGPEWLVGFGMDSNFGYRGLRSIYAKIN